MIAVVLVVGGGLGWFVRRAHDQRDAVESIGRKAGGVQFDWEFKDGKDVPSGRPWAPQWLVDRLGVDYFGSVTSVNLNGMLKKSDAELISHRAFATDSETLELYNADSDGRRSCSSRGPWQPPECCDTSLITGSSDLRAWRTWRG